MAKEKKAESAAVPESAAATVPETVIDPEKENSTAPAPEQRTVNENDLAFLKSRGYDLDEEHATEFVNKMTPEEYAGYTADRDKWVANPSEEKAEEEAPEPPPAPVETQTKPPQPSCGKCGSIAIGNAGGMRRCNQCGHQWS